MNSTLSNVIAFSIGAAVGAFVTWRLVTERYNKILEEKLKDVEKNDPENIEVDETKREEYKQVVADFGYSEDNEKKGEEFAEDPFSVIHIIDPEEMNDDTDLNVEYCTLYANDVLTDDHDNVMDIETTIGLRALEHFGEYDRDTVYVRNDETHTYYEVLRVDVMYDPE